MRSEDTSLNDNSQIPYIIEVKIPVHRCWWYGDTAEKTVQGLVYFLYNQLINMCEYIYAYVIFAIYMQGHTFEPLICV